MTAARSRVLVTGATGFLGRSVVATLQGTLPYCTTSRNPADSPYHRVADLTRADEAAAVLRWADPAVVIHLAGGRPATVAGLYAANVSSTASLMLAAAYSDQRPYVIVVGSASEYGSGDQITEQARISPSTPYGRAKTAQVAMARRLADREGIPLTVVRPFSVVGPGLPAGSRIGGIRQRLVTAQEDEPEIRCTGLDSVHDFVSVDFVAAVLVRLAAAAQPGRTLNICSGTGLTLRSVARAMADQVGLQAVFRADQSGPPAMPILVGDPTALSQLLGLRFRASAETVAAAILGQRPMTHRRRSAGVPAEGPPLTGPGWSGAPP